MTTSDCGAAPLLTLPPLPPAAAQVRCCPSLAAGTTHVIIQSRGAAHYGQIDGAAQQRGQQQGQQQAAAAAAAATAAAGGSAPPKDSIHTLCTGNGSPYQNYQLRIAYATYKLIQQMPGGERHVAFTR